MIIGFLIALAGLEALGFYDLIKEMIKRQRPGFLGLASGLRAFAIFLAVIVVLVSVGVTHTGDVRSLAYVLTAMYVVDLFRLPGRIETWLPVRSKIGYSLLIFWGLAQVVGTTALALAV